MLDKAAVSTCSGKNPFSQSTYATMIGWTGANATKGWVKHAHPPKKGFKPLEMFP